MAEMNPDEWRAFLRDPPRPAMLATGRTDDRADPRVAICVDDDRPPFSYVLVEGTAEVSEDMGDLLEWATRIGGPYMGAEAADAFGRRNAVPGELLVRVTPARVVARKNIAD